MQLARRTDLEFMFDISFTSYLSLNNLSIFRIFSWRKFLSLRIAWPRRIFFNSLHMVYLDVHMWASGGKHVFNIEETVCLKYHDVIFFNQPNIPRGEFHFKHLLLVISIFRAVEFP